MASLEVTPELPEEPANEPVVTRNVSVTAWLSGPVAATKQEKEWDSVLSYFSEVSSFDINLLQLCCYFK